MLNLFLAIIFLLLTILFGYSISKPKVVNADNLISSFIIGIPSLSLIIFLLSLILPIKPIYIFLIIIAISLISLRKKPLKIRIEKISWLSIFAIIFSLICITFYTYKQSYNLSSGLTFYYTSNTHDSLWHAALQNNLKISIPPENPVFSKTALHGYHYFTDIYFSLLSTFSDINTIDLAIRFIPLIIGLVFILSNYLLAKTIFKNKIVISLSTILLSIYSSQPYLFSKIFPEAIIHPSMFWLDQPATYLINPQLVLSISVINLFIYFSLKKKDIYVKHILLLSSLVGIKIYSIIAFLPTFFLNLFDNKKTLKKYVYPLLTIILIALTTLLIGSNSKQVPFFASPGWFIKSMFTTSDHLNHSAWELKRLHYLEANKFTADLRIIELWLYGLVIFLIGNFGLILLPFLISVIKNSKKVNKILLPIIISSILFPLIFLQSGIVWNTIQTLTYARIPIIISVLYWLRDKSFKFSISVISILIILSFPTIDLTYQSTMNKNLYQNYSAELINSIKSISPNQDYYVAIDKNMNSSAFIPAISSINLYLADPTVTTILNLDKEKRLEDINKDIENKCPGNFIYLKNENNKIKILDCPKVLLNNF